jgi:hypothetical protein
LPLGKIRKGEIDPFPPDDDSDLPTIRSLLS